MIRIDKKENCTGCHACASICPVNCITMNADSEGFWYPAVDEEKCINCDACVKVCPVLNQTKLNHEPKAYARKNTNTKIQYLSSSGGMFSLLAKQMISDGGVVFGAVFNEKMEVNHIYIDSIEDIKRFRGSKYAQSLIGETFHQAKDFLKQGMQGTLFRTPCQISGLLSFLGHSYDNLFCVDLICHGVPSPKVLKKYIAYQEEQIDSKINHIAFRSKRRGWPRSSVLITYKNGTETLERVHDNLYMELFQRNITLRPSCYSCVNKTLSRQSDITLADFWGIQNVLPDFDDTKGVSLVLIHNEQGQTMFQSIMDNITYAQVTCKSAIAYNRPAIRSVKRNPKREYYFEMLINNPLKN